MATWRVERTEEEVVLVYIDGDVVTHCGRGPLELEEALLEWVYAEAARGDLVVTPGGSFVKQLGPGGRPALA